MNTDRRLSGTMPMDSWTITIADDETSAATITSNDLVLVFVDGQFVVAEATAVPENAVYPTFYGVHATGVENIITNGEAIEKARAEAPFKNRDDFMKRTGVGQSVTQKFLDYGGILDDLPESAQINLFDLM